MIYLLFVHTEVNIHTARMAYTMHQKGMWFVEWLRAKAGLWNGSGPRQTTPTEHTNKKVVYFGVKQKI